MNWDFDMTELIIDFLNAPFSTETAERLIQGMGFGACNLLYAPADAAHLVLVQSGSEYAFAADDLTWLNAAQEVLVYQISTDSSLFFVNISCNANAYYTCCAAVIKVLNVAFLSKNIYIFRVGESLVIGSARDIEKSKANNFTVSALIKKGTIYQHRDFLEGLCFYDIHEIPYLIMNNSPQENLSSPEYNRVNVDSYYIQFLSAFESFYGADTSRERERCLSADVCVPQFTDTYKNACRELRDVVEPIQSSSYEDLDAAIEAEEKAARAFSKESSEEDAHENERIEGVFSEKAYENAEAMLKEMIAQVNERKEI